MFKVGDIVKVKRGGRTADAKRLAGRVGRITSIHISSWLEPEMYVILDICIEDSVRPSGIWAWEIELYVKEKKIIKPFGIVKFLESINV